MEQKELPAWVRVIAPKTDEQARKAQEYARTARLAQLVKYEPKEPEMKRNRAHGEDTLIGVTV
jgi:hypothetical protein